MHRLCIVGEVLGHVSAVSPAKKFLEYLGQVWSSENNSLTRFLQKRPEPSKLKLPSIFRSRDEWYDLMRNAITSTRGIWYALSDMI